MKKVTEPQIEQVEPICIVSSQRQLSYVLAKIVLNLVELIHWYIQFQRQLSYVLTKLVLTLS